MLKLDPVCIRALLLTLENILKFGNDLEWPYASFKDVCDYELMHPFSREAIAYATIKLVEAEYICARVDTGDNRCVIMGYSSITYEGHEFLEGVRHSRNWDSIRKMSGVIENASLAVIKAISEGVAKAAISKLLIG